MSLDAPHQCPHCPEAFHRAKGLAGHLSRVHSHLYPVPQELLDPGSDSPDQGASSVFDQENLRYALWQAYLQYRFSGVHLQHEDLRILDSLAALARSWKGP